MRNARLRGSKLDADPPTYGVKIPRRITTKGQAAIRDLTKAMVDRVGNLPPMPGIFPDYPAPIVRNNAGERELTLVRWGMPSSKHWLFEAAKTRAAALEGKGKAVYFNALLKMEPDGGTTNIRNVSSAHWKPWLGVENRCIVPFTSFSKYERGSDGKFSPTWFAIDQDRPLAAFAGIWTSSWSGVRKISKGWEGGDRALRFPHQQSERRRCTRIPEGDAGRADRGRGDRDLDDGALGRGEGASATPAGRQADGRGSRY